MTWFVVQVGLLCFCLTVPEVLSAAAPDPAMQNSEAKAMLIAADKLVSQGRSHYNDAVAKYSQVLALVADSPRARYSRAEVLHLLKRPDECIKDLEQLLQIAPAHIRGLELMVKLSSQRGDLLVAAEVQAKVVAAMTEKGDAKKINAAKDLEAQLKSFGASWKSVARDLSGAVPLIKKVRKSREETNAPDTIKQLREQERNLLSARKQQNERCVDLLDEIIQKFAKDNLDLRMKRVECALVAQKHNALQDELKAIIGRDKHNLRAAALNAQSLRSLGAIESAKQEVKRCLGLDPESAECTRLHKLFRQEQKLQSAIEQSIQEKKWENVIELVGQWFELDEDSQESKPWRWLCEGYHGLHDPANGLEVCETLLQLEGGASNPQLFDVYLLKADLYLKNDEPNAAEVAVNKAGELQPNHEKVQQYRQKLERLKQTRDRKDYYAILGVKATATSKDIRKAYRVLAKKMHPDHYRSKEMPEAEREKLDQQFRDINEAKEILLDDEKRSRYDAGEDVTKPQQQQQHHGFGGFPGGFGGFPGGGFHQGGGGHQFHFQFG